VHARYCAGAQSWRARFASDDRHCSLLAREAQHQAYVAAPQVMRDEISADGTRNGCWTLVRAMQWKRFYSEAGGTLCSQRRRVARLTGSFCSTQQGFNRNLVWPKLLVNCGGLTASLAKILMAVASHQCGDDGYGRAVAKFR